MDAEIHSVDLQKRESEGHVLRVRGAPVEVAVKQHDGLPFGEPRDRLYVEVRANSWDGDTNSTLTARLNADDLQRLFDAALGAAIIRPQVNRRAVELLEQLSEELTVKGRQR
jgi:hypothetical protein